MYEQLLSVGKKGPWVPPAVVPGVPYQGWVAPGDFIDGAALSTLLGLTIGTAHNNDVGWLHFIDGPTEMYIARKTLRYGGTSAEWLAADLQNGKTVTINGSQYLVRFPRVFTADNWSGIVGQATGREWLTYVQPIYGGVDRPSGAQWSYYTKDDLGIAENGAAIKNGQVTIGADKFNTAAANLSATGFHYSSTGGPVSRIAQCTYMGVSNGSAEIGAIGNNGYGFRPILIKQ